MTLENPPIDNEQQSERQTNLLSQRIIFIFVVFFIVCLQQFSIDLSPVRQEVMPVDQHALTTHPSRQRTSKPTVVPQSSPLAPRKLQPLQPKDWEQYTMRINTWQRPEQLLVSIDWHSKCPGVAQIQIVWCDKQNEPPAELQKYDKVVIERHEENSLNERFRVLTPDTPTLGILSIDDDLLRPCEALDIGFFRWTESPHRMVGFDGRVHVEEPDGIWKYGYMRDYLDIYMNELPLSILDTVARSFNCEDIAMSLMISAMTDGYPPLLADLWAIKSMVKLYSKEKISGKSSHKELRDACVDTFADKLGLKESSGQHRLRTGTLYHWKSEFFAAGDIPENPTLRYPKSQRQIALEHMVHEWQGDSSKMHKAVNKLMARAGFDAYNQGLLENSDKWKERFMGSQDHKAGRLHNKNDGQQPGKKTAHKSEKRTSKPTGLEVRQ